MPIQAYQIAQDPLTQAPQVSTPPLSVGQGSFFTKTVNGRVEAFYANGSGDEVQMTSNGILIGFTVFEKLMVNGSGAPIPANTLVSIKASDGSVVQADSDAADGQQPIGMTTSLVVFPGMGNIALFGRNMKNAVVSMGFAPGADIFLGESAGTFTDDPQGEFTGDNDTLIKIGVAACADGTTGAVATDLILIRQLVASP